GGHCQGRTSRRAHRRDSDHLPPPPYQRGQEDPRQGRLGDDPHSVPIPLLETDSNGGVVVGESESAKGHVGPYRVFRRLHFEGGWSLWADQANSHRKCLSEQSAWSSNTATSTTRSGPRFGRSPRRSDVRLSLRGGGLSKRNGTWESVPA